MARPKLTVPSVRKEVHIPENIVLAVDFLLLPKTRGRSGTGAWSQLVTQLLREWLQQKPDVVSQPTEDHHG